MALHYYSESRDVLVIMRSELFEDEAAYTIIGDAGKVSDEELQAMAEWRDVNGFTVEEVG